MGSVKLETVTDEQDLWVIVSDDVKWEKQCVAAVKQSNKILGMIKHKFVDRSKETVMALYKSLVRPHLKYCISVWNPHLDKDIKLLEGVQRRATKLVEGINDWDYDDRLEYLWLSRLVTRQVTSDLIETFKIMNNMYDINSELFF